MRAQRRYTLPYLSNSCGTTPAKATGSAGSTTVIPGTATMMLTSSMAICVPPFEAAVMPASPPKILTLAPANPQDITTWSYTRREANVANALNVGIMPIKDMPEAMVTAFAS